MSTKPHVLLISTDHWPAALLGEAGHSAIITPTLDELARSGTRFTNAYSTYRVFKGPILTHDRQLGSSFRL